MTDLVGRKFGRLTVTAQAPKDAARNAQFHVECVCGKTKTVRGESLLNGLTRSCGCLAVELLLKHGCARTTGRPKEYIAWQNACYSFHKVPDFPRFYALGPTFPPKLALTTSNATQHSEN